MIAGPEEGGANFGGLAVAAVLTIGFGFVGKRLQRSFVTGPIIFFAIGLLLGPWGMGLIETSGSAEQFIYILAQVAFALALFSDASRINIRELKLTGPLTFRVLFVCLLITILLGLGLGVFIFGGLMLTLLLVLMHAPTDQSFAQITITGEKLSGTVTQALNVESSLVGGLIIPFVILAVSLSPGILFEGESQLTAGLLEILIGLIIGGVIGFGALKVTTIFTKKEPPKPIPGRIIGFVIPLVCFFAAEFFWGSGLLASFVSGVIFGALAPRDQRNSNGFDFKEVTLATLAVLLLTSAVHLIPALREVGFRGILYTLGFLVLVRPIAALLSLIKSDAQIETKGYIGWFGPRGIATIALGMWTVREFGADAPWANKIYYHCLVTVFFSALLHGMTAYPATVAYAKFLKKIINAGPSPEGGKSILFPAREEYQDLMQHPAFRTDH